MSLMVKNMYFILRGHKLKYRKIQKGRVCISPWTLLIKWLEEGVSYINLMSGLAVTLWDTGSSLQNYYVGYVYLLELY